MYCYGIGFPVEYNIPFPVEYNKLNIPGQLIPQIFTKIHHM